MDKLVFDIETKNTFDDVGGRDHLKDIEVSIVCAYSYDQDKYFSFFENELEAFGEMARRSLLVGFSSKRFDALILEKHYAFNISALPHFDILDEIENSLGRRVSLDVLAKANLGDGGGKTASGLDAVRFYREGQLDLLKEYCLQDVKVTKEVFDLIRKQGYLWIPQKYQAQMIKLPIVYVEKEAPAQSRLI